MSLQKVESHVTTAMNPFCDDYLAADPGSQWGGGGILGGQDICTIYACVHPARVCVRECLRACMCVCLCVCVCVNRVYCCR